MTKKLQFIGMLAMELASALFDWAQSSENLRTLSQKYGVQI